MKKLKTFESFNEFNWDEFSQNINDLLMDLHDKYYKHEFTGTRFDNNMNLLKANLIIKKENEEEPIWTNKEETRNEFYKDINNVLEYISSEGFNYECGYSSLYINSPGIMVFKIVITKS